MKKSKRHLERNEFIYLLFQNKTSLAYLLQKHMQLKQLVKQRIRASHTLDARNIKVVPCPRLRRLSCSCILTWLSDDVSVFIVEVRSVNNIYQLIISLLTITIAFYFFIRAITNNFTRLSELHFLPQCNSWFSLSSVTWAFLILQTLLIYRYKFILKHRINFKETTTKTIFRWMGF